MIAIVSRSIRCCHCQHRQRHRTPEINERNQETQTRRAEENERMNRRKEMFLFLLGKNRENYSKFRMNEIIVNSENLTDSHTHARSHSN